VSHSTVKKSRGLPLENFSSETCHHSPIPDDEPRESPSADGRTIIMVNTGRIRWAKTKPAPTTVQVGGNPQPRRRKALRRRCQNSILVPRKAQAIFKTLEDSVACGYSARRHLPACSIGGSGPVGRLQWPGVADGRRDPNRSRASSPPWSATTLLLRSRVSGSAPGQYSREVSRSIRLGKFPSQLSAWLLMPTRPIRRTSRTAAGRAGCELQPPGAP
jgi:hypothetical protein